MAPRIEFWVTEEKKDQVELGSLAQNIERDREKDVRMRRSQDVDIHVPAGAAM